MVKAVTPNAAVKAGRKRKSSRAGQQTSRVEWFGDEVNRKVRMTMQQRVSLATRYLKNKVVENISVPVKKEKSSKTGRIVVTERSKPGEFPRADTTTLRKSIFRQIVQVQRGVFEGYVGMPLDYGLILETRMDRAFLARTLNEERGRITKILTGPLL